jgi:hypothetical protein
MAGFWLRSSVFRSSEPVAVLFGLPRRTGGKKSVRKFSKKFREVDMFAIAFYIENLLMASLPRAENAKHATGATDWEVRKTLEHSHIRDSEL